MLTRSTIPSAGLCEYKWCVEHELFDYGGAGVETEHRGVYKAELDVHGGIEVFITKDYSDPKPGVYVADGDCDKELWRSPAELRQYAAILMNAADALEASQSV